MWTSEVSSLFFYGFIIINSVRYFLLNVMSTNEEVGESHTLVVCNGSASRINYIRLQVYPVSKYEFGESLPYSSVELKMFMLSGVEMLEKDLHV